MYNLESVKLQLLNDEGMRLFPYTDTVGKLTIGVGRNIEDVGISKNEAMVLLENDLKKVIGQLNDKIPWWTRLDSVRQEVLINMAFNLGINGLLGFKNTLTAIAEGRYKDASKGMLDSKWAKQVGKRAERLALMMAS